MRPRLKKLIIIAPFAVAGILAFIAIGGVAVMKLWNWLLPPLFGWQQVTFWQALGLLALCRILFGGFHHSRGHGSRFQERMAERWERMTPEERERYRRSFQGRWGTFEPPDPAPSA
jgi:hypothetical protein